MNLLGSELGVPVVSFTSAASHPRSGSVSRSCLLAALAGSFASLVRLGTAMDIIVILPPFRVLCAVVRFFLTVIGGGLCGFMEGFVLVLNILTSRDWVCGLKVWGGCLQGQYYRGTIFENEL